MPDPTLFERARDLIQGKRAGDLRDMLAATPDLATARDRHGESLIHACQSYANYAGQGPDFWTAVECAEALLDAGSDVPPRTYRRALETSSTGMVRLFAERGLLPSNLRIAAATGDRDRVESLFDPGGELRDEARPTAELIARAAAESVAWPAPDDDARILADACRFACRHGHADVVRDLLARMVPRDPELRAQADALGGIDDLQAYLMERRQGIDTDHVLTMGQLVRRLQIEDAIEAGDGAEFARLLGESPELLTREQESFQVRVLEGCAFGCRPAIARALLDAGASVREPPRPDSRATVYAIDYGCAAMIELLRSLWPPKGDLPTVAGLGDLDAVKAFFGPDGELRASPTLVYPACELSDAPDRILLHALGLAIMNTRLDVASFLIDRGADVDGRWGLHEPAGLLHEAAANGKIESLRFLLGRGADVTLRDERFGAFACGWAEFAEQHEAFAILRPLTVAADFFAAVEFGTREEVEAHLAAGADADATIDLAQLRDVAPLFYAVRRGRAEIVELLLARGADASRTDSARRGALHRLEDGEHVERIARALIAAGADARAPDVDGVTPRDRAEAHGLDSVVALLR